MTDRLLTRSEVAVRWRVSEKTVDRRRADGSLQGTLIGGVWRYSLADVEACEQRGREAWREQVAHGRKGRSTGSAEASGTPHIETETARSAAAALAARIGRELRSSTGNGCSRGRGRSKPHLVSAS